MRTRKLAAHKGPQPPSWVLQRSRVRENAEMHQPDAWSFPFHSCFNGAASVRTRKYHHHRPQPRRAGSLQRSRVRENAEIKSGQVIADKGLSLQRSRVRENAEILHTRFASLRISARFNGAASVRTRKLSGSDGRGDGCLRLQRSRVRENAEIRLP